jgi:hypothetical protein
MNGQCPSINRKHNAVTDILADIQPDDLSFENQLLFTNLSLLLPAFDELIETSIQMAEHLDLVYAKDLLNFLFQHGKWAFINRSLSQAHQPYIAPKTAIDLSIQMATADTKVVAAIRDISKLAYNFKEIPASLQQLAKVTGTFVSSASSMLTPFRRHVRWSPTISYWEHGYLPSCIDTNNGPPNTFSQFIPNPFRGRGRGRFLCGRANMSNRFSNRPRTLF